MDDIAAGRLRRALAWIFRDRRTGAMTVGQWPNLPLWLFIALTATAWAGEGLGAGILGAGILGAESSGRLATWLRAGAHLALAWWAADEVLRGVNPWRRFLGGATLCGLGAVHLLT